MTSTCGPYGHDLHGGVLVETNQIAIALCRVCDKVVTEPEIVVVDADSIMSVRGMSQRDINVIPHIHNTSGLCLKNREGDKCESN